MPDCYDALRQRMVDTQLRRRDIRSARVLAAMAEVPRHLFMPSSVRALAYGDYPVGIGHQQTISQPYIVALMTQLSDAGPDDKVLEVGTGSGYQTAVLAALGARVYSMEILVPLAERARQTLEGTGYGRVRTRVGDAWSGWPEEAPFDAVVITAAPPVIPPLLVEQLRVGGRMVVPVGRDRQQLQVLTRTEGGHEVEVHSAVRFVPMTGAAQQQ